MSLPLGSPVSGLATKIFFDASITEISAIFLFICVIPKLHDEYNVYQTWYTDFYSSIKSFNGRGN